MNPTEVSPGIEQIAGGSNEPRHRPTGALPGSAPVRDPRHTGPEDEVLRSAPLQAARRLLRERVLENARLLLELDRESDRNRSQRRYVEVPDPSFAAVAGRLLSELGQLGAKRRGVWAEVQVVDALREGLEQGAAETLEILHELEELDAASWALVSGIFSALRRKRDAVRLNRH